MNIVGFQSELNSLSDRFNNGEITKGEYYFEAGNILHKYLDKRSAEKVLEGMAKDLGIVVGHEKPS